MCVCVMRHAKFCVIRNLMLARKEDEERSIFFLLCACVPVCVLYCTCLSLFLQNRPCESVLSLLSLFVFFCFLGITKQRVIIEMRFSFSQISCLVSWQKKSLVSLHKKNKTKSIQKHFSKKNFSFFFQNLIFNFLAFFFVFDEASG